MNDVICSYCGEPGYCCVRELLLETREIELDACCEWNHIDWTEAMRHWTRQERARWLFEETGLEVKDVVISDKVLTWVIDYGLHLEVITFPEARDFVAMHHRHCDPPQGWKYGQAVFNGPDRIGVMTAGRPTSAALDAQGCIEVTRVCVMELRPKELTDNACSMLYGYACREAFRRGHKRVVTYTKLDEIGTSLRAAGFVPVAVSRGGSWSRRGRPRKDPVEDVPRLRWERWSDAAKLPKQLPLAFPKTNHPRRLESLAA